MSRGGREGRGNREKGEGKEGSAVVEAKGLQGVKGNTELLT